MVIRKKEKQAEVVSGIVVFKKKLVEDMERMKTVELQGSIAMVRGYLELQDLKDV